MHSNCMLLLLLPPMNSRKITMFWRGLLLKLNQIGARKWNTSFQHRQSTWSPLSVSTHNRQSNIFSTSPKSQLTYWRQTCVWSNKALRLHRLFLRESALMEWQNFWWTFWEEFSHHSTSTGTTPSPKWFQASSWSMFTLSSVWLWSAIRAKF